MELTKVLEVISDQNNSIYGDMDPYSDNEKHSDVWLPVLPTSVDGEGMTLDKATEL